MEISSELIGVDMNQLIDHDRPFVFIPDALHGGCFFDIGNHSDRLVYFHLYGLASGFAHAKCLPTCCEHIRQSQEVVHRVYSLPDLVLVVFDRPRYIPLAIHNIAQVGVLVGGVDFLALQGHISSQLPAYSHYPALGGIHRHLLSVGPFGNDVQ
ncbi:hypothetical protein AYI70_g4043 [Smittium culicis]|uniref:Uncharacterized protein n=1 Tax=Smittium culicis TaxID=133412 RepID=A0A1R1Y163_9FUNG|nr:hypothetical protein AYI70_g4043 [Smittium culicis]